MVLRVAFEPKPTIIGAPFHLPATMPKLDLKTTRLHYEDAGKGRPVIFIHGVWMSSRFFQKQKPHFSKGYRFIAPDLRGHGRSQHVHSGHTIAQYARDLHDLVHKLKLKDVVLVGWSMGAFVLWDYIRQFGVGNIRGTVVVEESASDFKWADWPNGIADFPGLCGMMRDVQTDRAAFVKAFIPLMFKDPPSKQDAHWMFDEITRLPESIASSILFDQTVQDYRADLVKVTVPTLLCFGRDEKLIPVAGGEHLHKNLSSSRLIVFENSGHCPFLEGSDRFNREVDQFIQSLG